MGLLGAIANPPKSENKYVGKVFNWSEVHLSEMTCYKIHTLGLSKFCMSHQFRRIAKLERETQGKGKYLETNLMKSEPSLGQGLT